MTKEEYIKIKEDPKADFNEVMFFYYLLKGGKIIKLGEFIQLMNKWLFMVVNRGSPILFKDNLGRLVMYTTIKMDEYYGVK